MIKSSSNCEYLIYPADEVSLEDRLLLDRARDSMNNAYAPYSNFRVGCAILMNNGEIVLGSNQENASFPVGNCAETVGLSAASSLFPEIPPVKIAIATSKDAEFLTAPCGLCRQTLVEYEMRFEQNIAILLSKGDEVYCFETAKALLPFAFDNNALR